VARGDAVKKGQPIAKLAVRDVAAAAETAARVRGAFRIAEAPPAPVPLVLERIASPS
jgi:multidrug efflux pump subunit AcrA (membrane-fusion protein)